MKKLIFIDIKTLFCFVFLSKSCFPGGTRDNESAFQCKRFMFDPRVRKIPWKRKWQPTPVFLPGQFHGQESLAGYSAWGYKESDTTECTHTHTHTHTRVSPTLKILKSARYNSCELIFCECSARKIQLPFQFFSVPDNVLSTTFNP